MDSRGARSLLLALAAAASLPARAWAQTPPDAAAPPPVEPETPAPPPPAPPPSDAGPPARGETPPPPPAETLVPVPVPATVPSTWGPTASAEVVVETAPPPPVPRPRLSAAVGMGGSFDAVGFDDGSVRAIPSFFTELGIGDGTFGFDIAAFASEAAGRYRAQDPVDRLALDAFGVIRPGSWYRPGDLSFGMRVLHALGAELGLGFERDGRSAISGTRFLIHAGARVDLPISPAREATELRLRLAVRRGIGLYTPKLYGSSVSDYTSVHDSAAELFAALVVVF